MGKCIYDSLNQDQQTSISDFMKDFIVLQIKDQIEFFIKINTSADGAAGFINGQNEKFNNYIKNIGFPKEWEYQKIVTDHQEMAVVEIKKHFKIGCSTESKKLDSRYPVYEMDELRIWFEQDLKQIYPSGTFVKILTDNGLEYKDSDIQSMWDGVLFFTKKHKQLIDPTTGGLF